MDDFLKACFFKFVNLVPLHTGDGNGVNDAIDGVIIKPKGQNGGARPRMPSHRRSDTDFDPHDSESQPTDNAPLRHAHSLESIPTPHRNNQSRKSALKRVSSAKSILKPSGSYANLVGLYKLNPVADP